MTRPGCVLPLLIVAALVLVVVIWRLVYVSVPVVL